MSIRRSVIAVVRRSLEMSRKSVERRFKNTDVSSRFARKHSGRRLERLRFIIICSEMRSDAYSVPAQNRAGDALKNYEAKYTSFRPQERCDA